MVSELTAALAKKVNLGSEKSDSRSSPRKNNQGQVPKKIHKAEREKQKRDHLNELFHKLVNALELTQTNSGKASVLGNAARSLQELLAQVECLRKENVALLSESRYVTAEKNEIKEENSILEAEIAKLRTDVLDRLQSSKPTCNDDVIDSGSHNCTTFISPSSEESCAPLVSISDTSTQNHQFPVINQFYILPIHPEPVQSSQASSHVRRPRPRYPTAYDTWPLQLLNMQAKPDEETQKNEKETSSGI